jgi:flavodoxin
MNTGIFYLSRTGNTKRFAQAIADLTKAQMFDLTTTQPSAVEKFDLVILGTPVEGSSPAKETVSFIEKMPKAEGKKAILFCTCRIFGNARTLKVMEKQLKEKGYETIASVSKKGMNPEKTVDLSDALAEIKKAIDKQ